MKKITLLIVAMFILLLLQNIFGILNPPNNFIIKKTGFINSFFYNKAVNLKTSTFNFKNLNQLAQENQELKNKNNELSSQLAKLKFLEEENQILQRTTNFLKEKKFNYISGKIYNQNTDNANRVLITNTNASNGVKKDMAVINSEGILIGIITETNDSLSVIKLLSDSASQVSVVITGSTIDKDRLRSAGLLKGGFDLGMRVELVPQDDIIETGDFIISSGLDKNIPSGLLIGYVESVKKNTHEPFQTIFIKSAVDYSKITSATILLRE